MASDEAVLLVRIEAQMRQFERAMAKASGVANTTAGRIETRFRTMDRSLSNVGLGFARGLLGPLAALASARGVGAAINAFQRIENALKIAGLEGEEAGRVFTELTDIATRNGAPVEALTQLYGRLALTQKELGVNSAEILKFTNGVAAALRISGRSAEESRGALLQLSQAMGSGIVRAEEFNAILEGALPIAQAAARGLQEAGGSVAKLRLLIIDGKVSSEAFFRAFQVGQPALEALAETADLTLGQAFTNLQTQMIGALGRLDDLNKGSESLIGVMNRLGPAIGNVVNFIESLNSASPPSWFPDFLINGAQIGGGLPSSQTNPLFSDVVDQAIEAKDAIEAVEAAKEAVRNADPIEPGDLIAGPAITAEAETVAARIAAAFGDAGEAKPVSLADFPAPADDAARERAAKAIERQKEAVRELISDLEFENSLIGLSNEQRETEIALRRAGAVATTEQRAEIAGLVAAGLQEQASLDATIAKMDELRSIAGGALSSFTDSLREGEGLAGGLKSALDSVLDAVIRIAQQKMIESLFGAFGTAGGGFLGSLGGSSVAPPVVPGLGGSSVLTAPPPGGLARASNVIPLRQGVRGAMQPSADGSVSVVNNYDFRGADKSAIPDLKRLSEMQRRQMKDELPAMLRQHRSDRRLRG